MASVCGTKLEIQCTLTELVTVTPLLSHFLGKDGGGDESMEEALDSAETAEDEEEEDLESVDDTWDQEQQQALLQGAVEIIGTQRVIIPNEQHGRTYGILGGGFNILHQVWPSWTCAFSHCDGEESERGPRRVSRVEKARKHADVWIVDHVHYVVLMDWIRHAPAPRVVVWFTHPNALVRGDRVADLKTLRKDMAIEGYRTHYHFCEGTKMGGAITQRVLAVICWNEAGDVRVEDHDGEEVRSMSNLLTPVGIPRRSWAIWPMTDDLAGQDHHLPCQMVGRIKRAPVFHVDGPMPDQIGAWIATDRGVRHLLESEVQRAKGIDTTNRDPRATYLTTGVHIATVILDAVNKLFRLDDETVDANSSNSTPTDDDNDEEPAEETPTWTWNPPDLVEGGAWYNDRIARLMWAVAGRTDSMALIRRGKRMLANHRKNYTDDGPQWLQLLWWEFPPEHWTEVREGVSMNWLIPPSGEEQDNAPMTEEERRKCGVWADDLIRLGVLQEKENNWLDYQLTPLFCVAKPDGEMRPIADMKTGGQNKCAGKDPVYYPRPLDILNLMYAGGYSAVADGSKHFHNFRTIKAERRHMAVRHPVTGAIHEWVGLPMGSSQSPAGTARLTNGAFRLLKETNELFNGTPVENTWRISLNGPQYRVKWGHGKVYISRNGQPVVRIWTFVDDFLIHAPTYELCCEGFTAFLDFCVRIGFICQKKKTSPPSQVQKFCGFIFDTRGQPKLVVPNVKKSRVKASLSFAFDLNTRNNLSGLTLAVVVGHLQSLVDATPQRIGQTYLRKVYDVIHALEQAEEYHGKRVYYRIVKLTDGTVADLKWWLDYLASDRVSVSRTSTAGSLCVTWGDGSGTGTGGTIEHLNHGGQAYMDCWMGVWRPEVVSFSANWHELHTIFTTLNNYKGSTRLRGHTLFYFTDSLVTYWIMQSGSSAAPKLHELVKTIKIAEAALGCRVEAVHVPGELIIQQGSDNLSRGMWLNETRVRQTSSLEAAQAFGALPYSTAMLRWVQTLVPPTALAWRFHSEWTNMTHASIYGFMTLWSLQPETAKQTIIEFLELWLECPLESGAIFIIPRILQAEWSKISKSIHFIGEFGIDTVPFGSRGYTSELPFVVLHLPPHHRSLPINRWVEPSATPTDTEYWHRAQADELRGLFTTL